VRLGDGEIVVELDADITRSYYGWLNLVQVGVPVNKFADRLSSLLGGSATKLVLRLPFSTFHFRPLLLTDIYMAMGLWEPYVCESLSLRKNCIFIDVGAHIGYYASKALRAVGTKGLVIAIEPDPRNFEVLKENMKGSGLDNYIVYNKAVSVHRCVNLVTTKNPVLSHVTHTDVQNGTRIECMTLDSLDCVIDRFRTSNGLPEVTMLIDVEESENDVIDSGSLLIRKFKPRIIIEINDFPNSEARRMLEKFGYSHQMLVPSYYIFESKEE